MKLEEYIFGDLGWSLYAWLLSRWRERAGGLLGRYGRAGWRRVLSAGLWLRSGVGSPGSRVRGFRLVWPGGDGLGCARPSGELVAQVGDVAAAEPVAGEGLVVDLVELPAGVG